MNPFRRLINATSRPTSAIHRPLNRLRARLDLEGLETRLMPSSNTFVVPEGQPVDSSHFHTLRDAADAAGSSGVVTIELRASPDTTEPVPITQAGITIQGDPNVPASILPRYQISVSTDHVTLMNLNLQSVSVGSQGDPNDPSYVGNEVLKCLLNTFTETGGYANLEQNTITGSVTIQDVNGFGSVDHNTFMSTASGQILSIYSSAGGRVFENTFRGDSSMGVFVYNAFLEMAGNTIALTSSSNTYGIFVEQQGNGRCSVGVSYNTISTNGGGTGLHFDCSDGTLLDGVVEGNNFHNNAVGVQIIGDPNNNLPGIDLGQGPIGSVGGGSNNFRGFQGTATATSAAITIFNSGGPDHPTILAENNMFAAGVTPSQEIFVGTGTGTVSTDFELSPQQSFVQSLYNDLLGRSGTLAELNGWVNVLTSQGQSAVVNGILRSPESLGRMVDSLYLQFLGRQSDPGGRAAWVSALQHGTTLEQVEQGFLTSPEYINHIDTDFVQSLYINLLGRAGDAAGLAAWNNNIQALGLSGIANGFLTSFEFRADNVSADFQAFLHRAPTATGVNALAGSPADLLTLEATILDSQEAFANS